MPGHDIVVIGGSAGGLRVLLRLCAGLPERFPASVFVVLHLNRNAPSSLATLLDRASRLPARQATDGAAIKPGTITVAPPDHHLLLRPGRMLLRRGRLENRTRPAIDPLFRSAAVAFRSRVVGVVLSGVRDDGSAGLVAVKACGGVSVVQQPEDADWPEMPRNAIRHDSVDHSVTAAEMPDLLCRLVAEPPGPMPLIPNKLILQNRLAAQEVEPAQASARGEPGSLTCPQCGGVLKTISEPAMPRFRCQIGHGFSADTLVAAQNEALEEALESAMRIHRERVALCRRMERALRNDALVLAAANWHKRVTMSENAVAVIGQALQSIRSSGPSAGDERSPG